MDSLTAYRIPLKAREGPDGLRRGQLEVGGGGNNRRP